MPRIIVADDHALILEGLRKVLAREPDMHIVGEAGDRGALIALIESTPADVVLMDINMPGESAVDALEHIRSRHPGTRVLILSVLSDEQVALTFLKIGAAGYVSKEAAAEELVAAIRSVLAGERYTSAALAERIAAAERMPRALLSPREREVLRLIATGLPVKEISGHLALSSSTVHTYRTRILDKLNLRSDVELSRYAVRHHLVD